MAPVWRLKTFVSRWIHAAVQKQTFRIYECSGFINPR